MEDHNPLATFRAHINNGGCSGATFRPRKLREFEVSVKLPMEKVRRAGKADAPLIITRGEEHQKLAVQFQDARVLDGRVIWRLIGRKNRPIGACFFPVLQVVRHQEPELPTGLVKTPVFTVVRKDEGINLPPFLRPSGCRPVRSNYLRVAPVHEVITLAGPQTARITAPPMEPFYGICLDTEYPLIADLNDIAGTRESSGRLPKPLWG